MTIRSSRIFSSAFNGYKAALSILAVSSAFAAHSMAVVVFSDTFTGTGTLAGHTPEIGSAWTVNNLTATLAGGSVSVSSTGSGTAFGNFTQAVSATNPLLSVTIAINSLTQGAGISFYSGPTAENFFIGYTAANVFQLRTYNSGSPTGSGFDSATTLVAPQTLTFTYNFNTGATQILDTNGNAVLNTTSKTGLAIDRTRFYIQNNTRNIQFDSLQASIVPEASSSALIAGSLVFLSGLRRRKL